MKPWRLVVDTNLLVSALLFDGYVSRLVGLLETGDVRLLVSRPILEEYLRVLGYQKFRLQETEINFLTNEYILRFAETVNVVEMRQVSIDKDDDKFVECALAGLADAVISGDKHLLTLGTVDGIPILTLRTFISELLDREV